MKLGNFNAADYIANDSDVVFTVAPNKTAQVWRDLRAMPFKQFCDDFFSEAEEGVKDGWCYVPARIDGLRRTMDAVAEIRMAVLDCDCGHELAEIEGRLREKGWEGFIHSTFSHMTTHTTVSAKHYERWITEHGGTAEDYLLGTKGYLPHVARGASVVNEEMGNYIIGHNPCPKFRVIIPMLTPWRGSPGNATGQRQACAMWKANIENLAYALGLQHDQSCTDTSRLFYFPRVPSLSVPYVRKYIEGVRCDVSSLPDAPGIGGGLFSGVASNVASPALPREDDLATWAAAYADRFNIVAALKARKLDVFGSRVSGVKHHHLCPFDHEHTNAGDRSGTFSVNAADMHKSGLPSITSGFYIKCSHNGCAGRDRLDYVKGMLDAGWLSRGDLEDKEFLVPDAWGEAAIDPLAAFKSKLGGGAVVKVDGGEQAPSGRVMRGGNIGPDLLEGLPSMMQDFIKFCCDGAVKPQPALALGACLVMVSSVIGRKVRVAGWGTRPNVYIAAIARSGAGKERPMTAVKKCLEAAGVLDKYLGIEDIASDTGLIQALRDSDLESGRKSGSSRLALLDEIGFLLQAMTAGTAGAHLRQVVPLLLRLYSKSDTVFLGKSYADATKNFTINQPCLSMFGASTPEKLFGALTTANITDGLLSRAVLFDVGDYDPPGRKPIDCSPPQSVIDWIDAWDDVSVTGDGPPAMSNGEPVIDPYPVPVTAEADAIFVDFMASMEAEKARQQDGRESLYVRAGENALKFALIAACSLSTNKNDVAISGSTARWAVALSTACVRHIAKVSETEIVDTGFQSQVSAIGAAIRGGGGRGVTHPELLRKKCGKLPPKDLSAALMHLQNSMEVALVNVNDGKVSAAGHPVRPRMAYVWIGGECGEYDDDDE